MHARITGSRPIGCITSVLAPHACRLAACVYRLDLMVLLLLLLLFSGVAGNFTGEQLATLKRCLGSGILYIEADLDVGAQTSDSGSWYK